MKLDRRTTAKFGKLAGLIQGQSRLVIVLQDNPDPDAIGAAVALRRLARAIVPEIKCSITHGGTVGRGENRALVRYLDLNLLPIQTVVFETFDRVAMVDSQPGTGNTSLPAAVQPHIVFDHHPFRHQTRLAPFHDVRRRYGATSTILTEYLTQAGITPEIPLATALLYGIRSDTQDLEREATAADIAAFETLYPLANKRMLGAIQRGSEPRAYFQVLHRALESARSHGPAIVSRLGPVDNPDMIGEVADLLLREEQTQWTLVLGFFEGKLLFSIRTSNESKQADLLARRIVGRHGTGGGHRSYAGGQIPLADGTQAEMDRLEAGARKRLLAALGIDDKQGQKLIS